MPIDRVLHFRSRRDACDPSRYTRTPCDPLRRRVTSCVRGFAFVTVVLSAWAPVFADDNNSTPPVKPKFKIDELQMRAKYNNRVSGMVQSSTMPPGFPAPVYTSGQVSANFVSTTGSQSPTMAATIMTYDPASVVAAWYKQAISTNGWAPKNVPLTQQRAGEMYCLAATKGNTNVTVTCVKPKKGPYTIVNVSTTTTTPSAPVPHPLRDFGQLQKPTAPGTPAPASAPKKNTQATASGTPTKTTNK